MTVHCVNAFGPQSVMIWYNLSSLVHKRPSLSRLTRTPSVYFCGKQKFSSYPAFTRDISAGGNQYTSEIQRALSVGSDEAERIKIGEPSGGESKEVVPQEVEESMRSVTNSLVGEIARSLDFFSATATETRIQRVMLTGGSSRVPGFDAAFQERTGIEVELMNPLSKMHPSSRFDPEFLNQVGPSLGVGIGLALRKVDES